nr:hypothetical protein [Mycoplasmopsis bovis]
MLHPFGWDAFGLPAENAAIKHNIHPKTWTYQNISSMNENIKKLGISFAWNYECITKWWNLYSLRARNIYKNVK